VSKLNQIQHALLELDGGKFQKLADAYLVAAGYGPINAIGSVAGKNKVRRGTPDTLVSTRSGRYVLAEHTTQKSGLLAKLTKDLEKCLDENKTGIPTAEIECVIFCTTGVLDAREERVLIEIGRRSGVNVHLHSIAAISYDLYLSHPGLARDFLGIEIDTGQIVPLSAFVKLYNRSRLAARLDLGFHFREEELQQLSDALVAASLTIVAGRAGTGKSRLALEACTRFSERHPDYKVSCIYGRNRDLWEDIKCRFSQPGNFLILVDDANRISGFEYIVDLLLHHREDQDIKVVATVRDYALSQIVDGARHLHRVEQVSVAPFTDRQIKKLIADEYGIVNYHYLERISEIAVGNPRVAVMAAEVVKKAPVLSSIYDVGTLYEHYFSSIRDDLSDDGTALTHESTLRVAAIVSFFGAIDRTNVEMMHSIEDAFGVSEQDFWTAVERLHELEILDMYEHEVVRVSDQILATYLFYHAAIKHHSLDFGGLLTSFFPQLKNRIIDVVNPVASVFGGEKIVASLRPYVEREWQLQDTVDNRDRLLELIDTFWFVDRTRTLLWVRAQIEELPSEDVPPPDILIEKSSSAVPTPSVLSILRHFSIAGDDEVRMALELLTRYLAKQPSQASLVVHLLVEDYGFQPESRLQNYDIQHAVVDALVPYLDTGSPLFVRLFLNIAGSYLNTHFHNFALKNNQTVQMLQFELEATPELSELRSRMWTQVFAIYEGEGFRSDVLALIQKYSRLRFSPRDRPLIIREANGLLPFIESRLAPTEYLHCVIAHSYLDLLEHLDIEYPDTLRTRFRGETYALAQLLRQNWDECWESKLSFEDYEQLRRKRIADHVADYDVTDFAHLVDRCVEIKDALDPGESGDGLGWGVVYAMLSLAERDPELYRRVLAAYLEQQDPLGLPGYPLVQSFVAHNGFDATVEFLTETSFPNQSRWLFHIHEVLPSEMASHQTLEHLRELYDSARLSDLPHGLDYLLKYLPLDSQIAANTIELLVRRSEEHAEPAQALTTVFNPHTKVGRLLDGLLETSPDLVQRSYLVVQETRQHFDYDGAIFNRILDVAPDFVTKYIVGRYLGAEHGWLSSHDDERDYSFVWERPDYAVLMDRIVDAVYRFDKGGSHFDSYLRTYFQVGGRRRQRSGLQRNATLQDDYLRRLIGGRSQDSDFMEFLFGIVSHLDPKRRLNLVTHFVALNDDLELFERLSLEPNGWSSTGSWVPALQRRIDYWSALLPIMSTVRLLEHRRYVERRLHSLKGEIEREKKNDFMKD